MNEKIYLVGTRFSALEKEVIEQQQEMELIQAENDSLAKEYFEACKALRQGSTDLKQLMTSKRIEQIVKL